MSDCKLCKNARWDYEVFPYGSCQWFIADCSMGLDDPEDGECEEYAEDEEMDMEVGGA